MFSLLLLTGPAAAYSFTGAYWTWQDHPIEDPYTIAAADFPSDAGTSAEVRAAIGSSMLAWNAEKRDVTFAYAGMGAGALAPDGHPIIDYGDYPGLGSTLAFAATWTYDDGAAFDCDLLFLSTSDQGPVYWDADPAGPADGRYGIQNVSLHELGHCLGLDHSADSTAVMYAYYNGATAVQSDDRAGLQALYGPACADKDGDGFFGCDRDCDDTNAAIHPGAPEVCDGADGDCDGLVDAATVDTVVVAEKGHTEKTSWVAAANVLRADTDGTLVRFSQRMELAAGSRLVWSVYESSDAGKHWKLNLSDIGFAVEGDTQTSPDLYVPLHAGTVYAPVLGGMADTLSIGVDGSPDLTARSVFTPLGGAFGRAIGDDLSPPDNTYLFIASYDVLLPADPDGDGVADLCGDCAPSDASVFPGAPELCDGIDQDCDSEIDEGLVDCGATPDSGDTGAQGGGGEDSAAGDKKQHESGDCGCAAGPEGGLGSLVLGVALGWRRRRA